MNHSLTSLAVWGGRELFPCFPSWNPCLFLQRQMDLIKQQCCYVLGLTGSHGLTRVLLISCLSSADISLGNITFVRLGTAWQLRFLPTERPTVSRTQVLAGKSSYLTVTYWKIAIVQLVTWPRVIWWNQNPGVFALGLPANTQHLDFPDFHWG